MVADSEPLPLLRNVAQLRADPELDDWFDGATIAAVEVELPGRAVRVNISIDESLLERVDRAARAAGQTRSSFLAEAVRRRLAEQSVSSSTVTFDRLAYVDRLKDAGLDDKQARAHAEALDAALRDTVATKTDIDLLRSELRMDLANLETDLARWLFAAVLAIGGLMVAIEKILR